MADPSIYSEVVRAFPLVVGGLLAAISGVVTQLVAHSLTSKREQRNFRRERLESLVKSLYAHQQWMGDRLHTMVFRNEDHNVASPLNDARMLAVLHFPDLTQEVKAVLEAEGPLLDFIVAQKTRRKKDEGTWSREFDETPYDDAYKLYAEALHATTVKCRKLIDNGT